MIFLFPKVYIINMFNKIKEMLDSFFTLESLISMQGASLASLLVPNVLGYVIGPKFNKYRKYFSLIISFGLAFLIAALANIGWTGWIVAIFNGFLIFASAVGINQMSKKKEEPARVVKSFMRTKEKPQRKFFSNWF